MEKQYDLWDGNWIKVDEEYLEGVSNLEKVSKIYEEGNKIKVVYKDDSELYYSNVHGTWGFPTKVV
jgi:hypothetical protein